MTPTNQNRQATARCVRVEALVRLTSVAKGSGTFETLKEAENLEAKARRQRPTVKWERRGSGPKKKFGKAEIRNVPRGQGSKARKKHRCRFVARNDRSLKEATGRNFAAGPTEANVKKSEKPDAIFCPKEAKNAAAKLRQNAKALAAQPNVLALQLQALAY